MKAWVTGLSRRLVLGLVVQACHPGARFPGGSSEPIRISSDERVDDWRVSGEGDCPRFVQAIDGCYVLEVKYREDYTRVRGGLSQLWAINPLAAGIDTAARSHTSHYETGYVLFALQLQKKHGYYVTATFDGDKFMPRIVETNAAAERTREVFPASSLQELERCKAKGPSVSASEQDVCAAPVRKSDGYKW